MSSDPSSLTVEEKRALLAQRLRQRPRRLFPTSIQQQRIWFLDQLKGGDTSYNLSRALRVTGDFDPECWRMAVEGIVTRHEALRTTFEASDGVPLQVVHEGLTPEVELVDAPELLDDDALIAVASQEFARPFDLSRGPLLRMRCLRLTAQEHVLLITVHHIVADLWSTALMVQELLETYRCLRLGDNPVLTPPRLQYVDYSQWQATKMAEGAFEGDLEYWSTALAGIPAALELPTDRPRTAVQTNRGGSVPFALDEAQMSALRAMAKTYGVTPFMALLAAFATLMHRYSGADDVVVGVPAANRDRPEIAGTIGYFVNMLAMRFQFDETTTYADALVQARQSALGAFGHQDLPFERLVEDLAPVRDASRTPVFQVSFIYQNIPMPKLEAAGAAFHDVEVASRAARFDIELQVFDEEALSGRFEYNADLFDHETIALLGDHLATFVAHAVADPTALVDAVPLADHTAETALRAWEIGPERSWPDGLLTHERIASVAAQNPDRPAIVCGAEKLTYGELAEQSARAATVLAARGVRRGDRVAVCMQRGPALIAALLAVMQVGAAYVPMDPEFPAARITFMLQDAAPAVVISERVVTEQLGLHAFKGLLLWEDLAQEVTTAPAPVVTVAPSDAVYVIYTSGSTGQPKGVEIPHRALDNFLRSMQERPGLSDDDVLLAVTTISFDIAGLEVFLPLVSGARIILATRNEAIDGTSLRQLINEHQVTAMQATPLSWQMLLEAGWAPERPFKALVGGEALSVTLATSLLDLGVDLWNMYGPTETTIWSSVAHVGRDLIHLGEPIANTSLRVLDQELRRLPVGVPGELWIGGDGVANGYVDRPELTAERFVADPFLDGGRLYRTGDLVRRRHDGRLEFLGRTDHQVKIHGHRIELGEIERVLESHREVGRAVVIVRDDDSSGDRLVAYLSPTDETSSNGTQEWTHEVERWREVWDTTYLQASESDSVVDDNLTGWRSALTGEAIERQVMARWADETASTIMELHPSRVLEIGGGTGLILSRVAPQVERYWAIDTSATAVASLQARAEALGVVDSVRVERLAAHQVDQLPPQQFDLVVINSVAQYFPDERYLRAVIDAALARLLPGGVLFMGDVRSLPLLSTFHADAALRRTEPSVAASALVQITDRAVTEDSELVIDPHLFTQLADERDDVAAVHVLAKRSADQTDMTRYRYDVTIHCGEVTPVAAKTYAWEAAAGGLNSVREWLAGTDDCVVVLDIPNRRVAQVSATLAAAEKAGGATLAEVLREVSEMSVPDPSEIVRAVEDAGFAAHLEMRAHGADGNFSLVARRRGVDGEPLCGFPTLPDGPRPARLVNAVARRRLAMALPDIRGGLWETLPAYMVPSAFVIQDPFPMTPNGKIDRGALPPPGHIAQTEFVPPRTPLEAVIAGIWCDVLGIERVGVTDNFFDLGGHSLLSTRVMVRMRETFDIDVPLHRLFTEPTVEGLAAAVLDTAPDPSLVERTAELVVELSAMSDEEIAAQLGGAED
ncbi:hypothetical protein GCM10027030_12710 [Luteococcus sediminum]